MVNNPKDKNKSSQQLNKQYSKKLKRLKETGIYSPSTITLSKSQKSTINRYWNKYGDELDKSKTLFIKIPHNERYRKTRILQNAKSLKMKTTQTGIFVTKNGQRRGRIAFNTKTHETEITLSGKVKWGKNVGKRVKQIIPVVSIDKMESLEKYILQSAQNIGPLNKNEALQFRVQEDGREGLSHRIFQKPEMLLNYLKHNYQKEPINKILFYRHIIVEKTTIDKWANERHSRLKFVKRKTNKKGRSE